MKKITGKELLNIIKDKEFKESVLEEIQKHEVDVEWPYSAYFCVLSDGSLDERPWYDCETDRMCLNYGNCFKTMEEAKRERDRHLLDHTIRSAAAVAWKEYNGVISSKYSTYIERISRQIGVEMDSMGNVYLGETYFPTRESCIQFIKGNRKLIDKLYHTKNYKLVE